jgi:hypothetical protein
MSKPSIKETVGGYEFTWEQEKLNIKVSRVQVHTSDGRVTGELLITSAAEGNKPIYPQTHLNFNSEQTRTRLARTLESQDSRWKWQEIINQLALAVIDRARRGEPVRELWTNEKIKAPEFILEPILYKGLPTIIFGEKAVCKSTLALVMYACLILPWWDNPLGLIAPARPFKALIADYEVDYDVAQWNAKRLQEGMELPAFPLYYRRCALPLADDIEQLHRHVADIGAEVLIVDSLGPAVGGDLKDPGQALRFTTALRQLKCSALIIGQTSKDRESKVKSVFGSTFFEYYARNIWELRKVQDEGEDALDIALYNTYHNLGRKFKAMGFHLSFNGVGTRIEKGSITAPELIERMGAPAQIQAALTHGSMFPKEIAEECGLKEDAVRQALKRMKTKNLVVKLEDGSYGLQAKIL